MEYGGGGASLPQLFELLIELAAADSNVPQALRGHFAFAEDRLNAPPSAGRDLWFKRFVDGDIVGCAWTEIGNVAIGDVVTQVSPDGDNWTLNGEKFYSTGSIFADWIDVYAQRSDTKGDVIAATRARQPGVEHSDDWDGFGQRTTGNGRRESYAHLPMPRMTNTYMLGGVIQFNVPTQVAGIQAQPVHAIRLGVGNDGVTVVAGRDP